MKTAKRFCWMALCAAVLVFVAGPSAKAQSTEVRSRIVSAVDDTQTVRLQGNVHPLARPANDQGALAGSQPMTRMLLLLQRSTEQEMALRQSMDAQQTNGSGSYHAWLTPEQFGKQYGPSDADVQAVTDWLTKRGFQVSKVAAGRTAIEFSGNVGQVRNAFHTEIHRYVINGEEHFANASDPAIPVALAPVVAGVVSLHNFPKQAQVKSKGAYRRIKETGELQPLFTFGSPANFALGPGDWAKIYSVPAQCGGQACTGAGQTIAIVADSNINTQDVVNFRSLFGLPAYSTVCPNDTLPTQCQLSVIVNGPDPGLNGDEIEADLDTEWAGAVAPAAQIILVVSEATSSNPTQVSQGIDLSALFIIDNNLAPVLSESFGACESSLLTTGNQFYNSLWEQAASQGITVVVSSGDSGPAGCDPSTNHNAATQGVAVSGIASTPYNVAVGGTDFDPSTTTTANAAKYWTLNTNGDVINSALGYIPETTWDDSACALAFPTTPCTSVDTTNAADLSAASGGPSNCILGTQNSSGVITCGTSSSFPNGGYLKPSFQIGITPLDSVRDIPDVSFFSSNGGPIAGGSGVAIVICQSDSNPQGSANPTGAPCSLSSPYTDFGLAGGTSAATPTFAGVMALVNQSTGQRQGNANYVLYKLAVSDTNYAGGKCTSSLGQTPTAGCVFNDVTKGNNSVACDAGTANCSNTSNTAGAFGVMICNTTTTPSCPAVDNGTPAFLSGTGYDLATGLGSINVTNLLSKWTAAIRTGTTTTLTGPSGGTPSGTAFSATVSVAPTSGTLTPTGDVSLIALASDGTTVLGSFGPFTLSGGTTTVTTNLLPPGTASVEGSYGGDASFGASKSAAVALSGTVAGANQASTLTVYYVGFDANGNPLTPTTNSQNFVYGSGNGYILKIVVTGPNGSCSFSPPNTKPAFPCPTGTIKLMDGPNPLNDFLNNGTATNQASLNNQGFAEDQPINVGVGTHNITATYSGDKNYAAANTSNTLTLTVTQASTTTTVASSLSSITKGTNVTLTATVGTTSFGVGPTGSVQFSNGGTSLGTATCTPTNATSTTPASCTATLTTAISGLYPPPERGPGPRGKPVIPWIMALASAVLFALGWRWIPAGRRRAYAYAGLIAFALLAAGIAGCGGGGSGSSGSGPGTRTINAVYPGDANYKPSNGSVQITVM
jgi:hypothetical protein